jgi:PiT family inorganic phosphate transporter
VEFRGIHGKGSITNWNAPNLQIFMDSTFALVAVIVIIVLTFDYTNGFHDAANSIATIVSTRALAPARAVMLAAFFNFIAFFPGMRAVAKTVYSGLVDPKPVDEWVVIAGLIGAN